ncbi:MAG TPA: hypothetical protein VGE47_02065, partial [Burkholderiaceae bacterium]
MLELLCNWLLAYLLHSTGLLGGVWLLDRTGLLRRFGAVEFAWRVALFGALLTASLQVLAPALPRAAPPAAVVSTKIAAAPQAEAVVLAPVVEMPLSAPPARHRIALPAEAGPPLLLLAALWAGGAALALLGLFARLAWLRASLTRLPHCADEPTQALAGLARR